MRRWRSLLLVSCLAACVTVPSCLVPNKELVDSLPSSGGGTAGASDSVGGDGSESAGTSSIAGKAGQSGGGSSNAGTGSGGKSSGGSGGNGDNGGTSSGGTGMMGDGGSATEGGGAPGWHFGDATSCSGTFLFCDDFEKINQAWPPGAQWTRGVQSDAPSGTHVMQTGFHDAPLGFHHAEFSLSFWVRFTSKADQAFITWPRAQGDLYFGLEESVFRFRFSSNPPTVAPEKLADSLNAVINTWTCVKLVAKAQEIRATVTVLGQKPIELPVIGGTADPGIDQLLLQSTPGSQLAFDIGDWFLADPGTDIELDDVRVGSAAQRTICDEYNDGS
ncbi:MAG TPA: hypothetical protein VHB79_26600 [Polyangiaceae bacterium]|nr:hypothetical protein [Polyangiaceae bacterium]